MSANPYEPPSAPLGAGAKDDFPDVTSVTCALTLDEVNRARAALAKPAATSFVLIMLAVWFYGLVLVVASIPGWARSLGCPPRVAGLISPTLIGLSVIYLLIRRLLRIVRDRAPAPERTVELHPEGVVVREPGSFELTRTWAGIEEIKDNGKEIIFLIAGYNYAARRQTRIDALPVPRRAFPAPGAAESFLRVARGFWTREHSGV